MIFSEWKNIQAAPALSILKIWKNAKAFFVRFDVLNSNIKIFLARAPIWAIKLKKTYFPDMVELSRRTARAQVRARTYNVRRWICMIK